jgi:hypothetical protein
MDIVKLLILLVKVSLALVPFILLGAVVVAYSGDLGSLVGYLTGNPVITIMVLGMETALENTYIALFFGLAMMSVGIMGLFRVFA